MKLCAPAIIYLLFSITQILIDTYRGLYNTAVIKSMVAAVVTLLLNILCERGLGVVSWIIVFIPFILMTVIVSLVLYVFGLDAAVGKYANTTTTTTTKTVNVRRPSSDVVVPEYEDIHVHETVSEGMFT